MEMTSSVMIENVTLEDHGHGYPDHSRRAAGGLAAGRTQETSAPELG